MSPLRIAIRAVIAYVFLLALLRVSGKRLLAEATGMQFVLAIVVGDLIDDALFATVPFGQFVVAAGTLTLLQLVIAVAAFHDIRVWRLIEGEPPTLLQNGMPRRQVNRQERVNRKELASLLRLQGISAAQWAEIKRARIEEGGVLAVIRHEWAKPAQRRDAEFVKARARRRGG